MSINWQIAEQQLPALLGEVALEEAEAERNRRWAEVCLGFGRRVEKLRQVRKYASVVCAGDCDECEVKCAKSCMKWPDFVCDACPCKQLER